VSEFDIGDFVSAVRRLNGAVCFEPKGGQVARRVRGSEKAYAEVIDIGDFVSAVRFVNGSFRCEVLRDTVTRRGSTAGFFLALYRLAGPTTRGTRVGHNSWFVEWPLRALQGFTLQPVT
jgi:hypothetical protein